MNEPKHLDEDRLRELWATDATCKAIGDLLGCSGALVSKRALEMGLPRRTTDPAALPARKIIVAYRDHGMTLEAIRDQLRSAFPLISVTGIRNLLIANRVTLRHRSYRRENKGLTHLAECVRLARQEVPYRVIGEQFGLTPRQVGLRVLRVLNPRQTGQWTKYDREAILAAYETHGTYHGAAREVGCHWSCVRYHVARRKAVAS